MFNKMFVNRIISKRLQLSLLCLFCSLIAVAQELPSVTVTPKLSNTSVLHNGVYYSIVSDAIVYEMALSTEEYTIIAAEWELKCDGEKYMTSNAIGNQLEFAVTQSGTYTLTGNVTVEWYVEDVRHTARIDVEDIPQIIIIEQPTLEIVEPNVVTYSGNTFEATFKSSALEVGEWKIEWNPNNLDGNGYIYRGSITNEGESVKNVEYNATCKYVIAGKALLTQNEKFTITVYPKVRVYYSHAPRTEFNTAKDSAFTLGVEAKGGYPGGWVYEWTKEGDDSFLRNTSKIDVEAKASDNFVTEKYKVVARNYYEKPGTSEREQWGDSFEKLFTINTFPEIKIELASASELRIAKDTTVLLKADTYGGYDDGWTYEWTKYKNGIETDTYKTSEPNLEIKIIADRDYGVYTYKLVAKNSYNGDLLGTQEATFAVVIYKTPKVYASSSNKVNVVGGLEYTLAFGADDGNPNGWEFTWYRILNGSVEEIEEAKNKKSYTFIAENDNLEPMICNYRVEITNKDGDEWLFYNTPLDFSQTVYQKVSKSPILESGSYDLHKQDTLIGALFTGACDGGWKYEWYLSGTNIKTGSEHFYEHKYDNQSDNIKQNTYLLIARNFVDNEEIYEEEISYTINEYPIARTYIVSTPEIIISGNKYVDFEIKAENGDNKLAANSDADGWSYRWFRDDEELKEQLANRLTILEENENSTESLYHIYKVVATNKHNGYVWHEDTLNFTSTVRPRIREPKQKYYEVNIREGDEIVLGASEGWGGCPGFWTYEWKTVDIYGRETTISGQDKADLEGYMAKIKNPGHDGMENAIQRYVLYYENIDSVSDEIIHDNGTINYEIMVYRRPVKPYQLVKKGNGNSNIFIADMYEKSSDLDNEELLDNEYNFCFGYGNNSVIPRDDTTMRYQIYTKEQSDDTPWVYTYWVYEDGYICKSDTTYYNGATRTPTSIDDIYSDDVISVNEKGFKASTTQNLPAVVRFISMNGDIVKQTVYEENCEFAESFDTDGIERGFYIVEVLIGNNRGVNKVFIGK